MVNPIVNGANLILGVFYALPLPFQAFTILVLALGLITLIVKLIMR